MAATRSYKPWYRDKVCVGCGADYWGHCNSRYCKDCYSRSAGPAPEQERRARKHGLTEHFTNNQWYELCEKYGNRCLSCGRDKVKLQADHVVPLALGGVNTIDNIQPLCKNCNSSKWAKVIDFRPTAS